MIELSFEDREIRMVCEDEDKAKAAYGHAVAQSLQSRLADLEAAADITTDIIVGNPEKINDSSNYKIDLGEGFRLIFCSNHINPPLAGGEIDWKRVTRVRLLKIEKTDD